MLSFYQHREENYTSQVSTNNSYPPHLHKQVELIYVTSGTLEVSIDGSDYTLSKGDISICFPNLIHSTKTLHASTEILLIFDVALISDFSNELLKTRPLCPYIQSRNVTKTVINCINELNKCFESATDSRIITGYFCILLGYLLPQLTLIENKGIYDLNACQQILIYIDSHFKEHITLDSLSVSLNISKYYISHIFTSKVKLSFPTYLNIQRARYAKHLLKTTTMSVTEISYDSGFNSSRTFYRVFKELYHITPLQYRESLTFAN